MAGPNRGSLNPPGRGLPWAAAVLALVVYLLTVAPGLTFAHYGTDGGDLIAAAQTLGVAHPTGYPTYTLLAWLFTRMPLGTVAYRVNLLSAVGAAGATGVLAAVACRLLPDVGLRWLLAGAAALATAFSPLLWSQAVIAEVYTLQLLLAAFFAWLLVRWRQERRPALLGFAAFVLGVGLGTHLTLGFVVPAGAVLLWPGDGQQRWRSRRSLALAAASLGLLAVGLSVYGYLPLAARGRSPVCWGDPQTWERFRWLVSGEAYRGLVFGLEPAAVVGRLGHWAQLAGDQFGWWGLGIALVGAGRWWQRNRRFALFSVVWSVPLTAFAFFYDAPDAEVYLLPIVWLLGLAWAEGAAALLQLVPAGGLRLGQWRTVAWNWIAVGSVLALPLVSLVGNWRAMDLADDRSGHTYVDRVLEAVSPGGLVVVRSDRPTFGLWYGLYAEALRPDVAVVNGPLLQYDWYRAQIRRLYPRLFVPEPYDLRPNGCRGGSTATAGAEDDLVCGLVTENQILRPIYVTDPDEAWKQWFDWTQEGEAPVYRVQVRSG